LGQVFQARPQEQMKKKAFHAQRRVLFVFFTDEFPSFEKEASHKSLDFLHQFQLEKHNSIIHKIDPFLISRFNFSWIAFLNA
jgi:hypothetical protein